MNLITTVRRSKQATLKSVIDPMVGELWDSILSLDPGSSPVVSVFSDHGQIRVIPDDAHSLRLAFPYEREIGHLFDALGLDVHDYPGEDPDCDLWWLRMAVWHKSICRTAALVGQIHLSLTVMSDLLVVPSGKPMRQACTHSELQGALAGVLIRNVQAEGWYAGYHGADTGRSNCAA